MLHRSTSCSFDEFNIPVFFSLLFPEYQQLPGMSECARLSSQCVCVYVCVCYNARAPAEEWQYRLTPAQQYNSSTATFRIRISFIAKYTRFVLVTEVSSAQRENESDNTDNTNKISEYVYIKIHNIQNKQ